MEWVTTVSNLASKRQSGFSTDKQLPIFKDLCTSPPYTPHHQCAQNILLSTITFQRPLVIYIVYELLIQPPCSLYLCQKHCIIFPQCIGYYRNTNFILYLIFLSQNVEIDITYLYLTQKQNIFIIGSTTMIYELICTLGTRGFYTVGTVEKQACVGWTELFFTLNCLARVLQAHQKS